MDIKKIHAELRKIIGDQELPDVSIAKNGNTELFFGDEERDRLIEDKLDRIIEGIDFLDKHPLAPRKWRSKGKEF